MTQKFWILVGVVVSALLTSWGEATGMTFLGQGAWIGVIVVTILAALIYSDVVNRNFSDPIHPQVWPPIVMLGWNVLNTFLTIGFNYLASPVVREGMASAGGLFVLFSVLSGATMFVGYLLMSKIGLR